jgi:hypothetical protein
MATPRERQLLIDARRGVDAYYHWYLRLALKISVVVSALPMN